MLRRFLLLLPLFFFLLANTTAAADSVQVLVLPFEIHADQDLSYLKEEIPKTIREDLQAEGAVMVPPDSAQGVAASASDLDDVGTLRQTGLEAGADYIVWGSLTRIGDSISLDTRMIESVGTKPVYAVYEAGAGMESLRNIVNQSSQKLARHLFSRDIITQIRVTGNRRIEADAIERVIRSKTGDVLRAGEIAKDMKNIYKMGYFDDIRVESETDPDGKVIVFHVTEKPTIRRISLSGNQVFEDDKLRENLNISTGSILNIFTIKSNIDQLQSMYKDKNYHNVNITYAVHEQENNQADIEFVIEEGNKVKIDKITFLGNTTLTDKELLKLIKTSERGFFSWLTSSGELNREDLKQDAGRIMGHYQISGFIHAKVADPVVDFEDEAIHITFKIEEGERFKVGRIDIQGDLIIPKEKLMPALKIAKEPFFSRETVRQDIVSLTDVYANAGFAYASVSPLTKENRQTHLVDITYSIDKGEKVYFENIEIVGNTRTRDKVIRRELRIYEQQLYSGSRLKRSVRNLNRLDYFEDVKVDTPKGSADDRMRVKLEVTEKPTGSFTFGAGYSTVDKFFVTGSITQRNLFGRGQTLKLSGQIGGSSDLYNIGFTEPWLFDIPLSGTVNIYRQTREYDTYDRTSRGGTVGVSYPIWDYTRVSLAYRYDITDLDDIEDDANDNVKALEGENATSAVTIALTYDSRDKTFNTTNGQYHRLAYTYAGPGGDIGFNKVVAELGWYIPVFKNLVTFLHGESGTVRQTSGYILPDYEKFYLGGMNSIRGFDYQDINIPTVNSDGEDSEEGGLSYVQFNFELTYPIVKDLGLVGVLFYDTGNVYADESIDIGDLRQSAGYGIRWYSPIGPIRIEAGHILDPREDEDSSAKWEFSMGAAF
ncbi:outer membrane protein assembly factor BamA [Desulfosarcina ovata]|uniref:Outer membrane protein assembly factor BamA n=1 Tax=Desulfosarcina ovata subsp. ovata TaxID=2752305 RepID=A0A5K8A7X0_9BACT|nr:outer membrane protein assembly factor BamA [Desulfosarcina ovata]BBO88635.1 outer membrane protein assembly factor BamA [Desulfosarcina ovata subsp. ovata]